jgi:hypothetical protein
LDDLSGLPDKIPPYIFVVFSTEAWISVFIFGVALIVEKAQTIYHAKHYVNEYIPEDETFAPLTAPA